MVRWGRWGKDIYLYHNLLHLHQDSTTATSNTPYQICEQSKNPPKQTHLSTSHHTTMSQPLQQPLYAPISFISSISETTRPNPHNPVSPTTSLYQRLSIYLLNAITLEDSEQASRRESVISGHAEAVRRANSPSTKEDREWRKQSVEGFWRRYGSLDERGERRRSVMDERGEGWRRGRGSVNGKWRKMSWGVKRDGWVEVK